MTLWDAPASGLDVAIGTVWVLFALLAAAWSGREERMKQLELGELIQRLEERAPRRVQISLGGSVSTVRMRMLGRHASGSRPRLPQQEVEAQTLREALERALGEWDFGADHG